MLGTKEMHPGCFVLIYSHEIFFFPSKWNGFHGMAGCDNHFKNIFILNIVLCLVTQKKKISDVPVTSCESADDMTSPSTVDLLWSLWAPSREAKEISSNPISHVTARLKPEKWNIFPFDVREVFACHRELYMTSKALMIKMSFGPPQPLMAQLMSMRGEGRPQSPASRHIACCLLLVCYFHWFLNTAGRLFKAKMKSMGFKGQKCHWPHPPAWARHERLHLSCRSDIQTPLCSSDGRIVTHLPY